MVPQNHTYAEISQRLQVGTGREMNKRADSSDTRCYREQRIISEENLMDAKHQDTQRIVSINSRQQKSIKSHDIEQQNKIERYENIVFSDMIHTGKMPLNRYLSATSTQPAVLVRLIKYDTKCQKDVETES